jgi:hypothetical protein
MTIPATGTGSASVSTLAFTGDNNGTLIVDSANSPNFDCYQKINYRGEPHEWGAWGDGTPTSGHDDTVALEGWLGAFGNPPATTSTASYPTNYGPWIATSPANYLVSSPLSCPPNATLMGPANFSTNKGTPPVRIFAGGSFSGGPAVLEMNDHCRLSGIAIDASQTSGIDAVDIDGTHVGIDGHALIENAGTGAYDVSCGATVGPHGDDGLQIKNAQIIGAGSDNIHLAGACPNVRLIDDTISGAGGNGVYFTSTDLTIADGTVEQSQGVGINLNTARYVAVSGEYIDHNGKSTTLTPPLPGIQISGSSHISLCGNHIQGSGATVPTSEPFTSQIYFSGTNDNISLCGNAYTADNLAASNIGVTPQYVYDADSTSVLTNSGTYESPGNHANGVYSPNAALILPQIKAPHVPVGFISGLQLSNSGTSQTVVIGPGEASDSTGSASIVLPGTCSVNLNVSGNNGLDTGTLTSFTTYFFYLIANPGGGNPSCIASTSPTGPSFSDASFSGTGYQLATTGSIAASNVIFNVGSITGASVNDPLTLSASPDIVSSIGSFSTASPVTGFTITSGSGTSIVVSSATGLVDGMQISDGTNCFQGGTYITSISGTTIGISNSITCTPSGEPGYASNAQQIVLTSSTTQTRVNKPLTINTGIYRLLGALYTDNSMPKPHIVLFTQEGDTFYLTTPVKDVDTAAPLCSGTITDTPCQLSVPCGRLLATCASPGVKVEALGRIVGGTTSTNPLLVSSPDQDNVAANFPTVPGYSTANTSANASYPFRVYTDSSGNIRLTSTGAGTTTASEITDGWVFHR